MGLQLLETFEQWVAVVHPDSAGCAAQVRVTDHVSGADDL
jgi:hypothetical protein